MKRILSVVLLVLFVVGCPVEEPSPEPGDLEAGISRVRMPAPVGIGTAGFAGFTQTSHQTPFSDLYPGTRRVHGHPSFEILVLSRGPGHELVFVRMDTVGVFQQFRRAVVLELRERLGRDLDDALIIGATHTHAGPGRLLDVGGVFDLITDTFFPEFYEGMVEAVADGVEAAYADLAPARIGHATAWPEDAHRDRRCENGVDVTNSAAPMVVVERDGRTEALLLSFAVHGTVLGIDTLTLSADVHGAMEEAVEDRFDHPVEVLLLNSWGADMSPASPSLDLEGVSPRPGGYDRMEGLGSLMADAVEEALADVRWVEDPALWMRTTRVPIDRDYLGYDDETFPYEHGGVYCGLNNEEDCDPETTVEGLDHQCVAFPEEYPAPKQTELSVGQIGDVHFVTWPGEPGTLLAEEVVTQATARSGVREVMFLGYAQDYLGYSLTEEDWWQGGYEAAGGMWGPRQGDYLIERLLDALDHSLTKGLVVPDHPSPVRPFDIEDYAPREATAALAAGEVLEEVEARYAPDEVVVLGVAGHDPWLGAPVATLERADGTPVTRPGGRPLDSDGYAFWVDLLPDPSYGQAPSAEARTFLWRFHLPITRPVAGRLEAGSYRLRVVLADGSEVLSEDFLIED